MKVAKMSLPFLLLFVTPIAREQNAVQVVPLEQCRADADAWSIPNTKHPAAWDSPEDEFSNFNSKMALKTLSSRVLNARNDELMQCVNTDRLYSSRYALASFVYKIAMFERMGNFMERHNLVAQFYLEDELGKR